jgi:RNA polymerase-binding transcription factor DksA
MSGYAGDASASAQQNHLDVVDNAIVAARLSITYGCDDHSECLDCGDEIPLERRQILPGVMYCVHCQPKHSTKFNIKTVTKML